MIGKIRICAPYVYLCRRTTGGYDLYILVPVKANQTVSFPLLSNVSINNNGTKVIEATVMTGQQNIIERDDLRFAKKYYAIDDLADFKKITIFVNNGATSNYRNTSHLEDVFDAEAIRINGMATNCPYTYLAREDDLFYPRMILPLYGTTYSNNDETISIDNNTYTNSIYLQTTSLSTDVNIVIPDKINTAAYADAVFEGIEFDVLIDEMGFEGTETPTPTVVARKKKGKRRKGEADS